MDISEQSCSFIGEGILGSERSNIICSKLSEIIRINELITPYYREMPEKIGDPVHRNYSSYHIFCLKKNIMPFVKFLNKSYSVNLSSKVNADQMVMVIEVYEGSKYIKLENETYEYLKMAMDKALELYPKCLIYDFEYSYSDEQHKIWAAELLREIYQTKTKIGLQ